MNFRLLNYSEVIYLVFLFKWQDFNDKNRIQHNILRTEADLGIC